MIPTTRCQVNITVGIFAVDVDTHLIILGILNLQPLRCILVDTNKYLAVFLYQKKFDGTNT